MRATASGIAGAYLALAGCLSAYQFGFVGPTTYNFALSVQMLFGLVVGGMYSLSGAILGGLFLQFFPDVTAGLGKGFSALLYAVLLIIAMVAMPDGVAGALSASPPRSSSDALEDRRALFHESAGGFLVVLGLAGADHARGFTVQRLRRANPLPPPSCSSSRATTRRAGQPRASWRRPSSRCRDWHRRRRGWQGPASRSARH